MKKITEDKSLRNWAKKVEIWEPRSWKYFLQNDLIPFYNNIFQLNEVYQFIKTEIGNASSIDSITDEEIKEKIRISVIGGIDPNKDKKKSFAKFMYDIFGVSVNAPNFEDSIANYKEFGDSNSIILSNPNSLINKIDLPTLLNTLRSIITSYKWEEIGITLEDCNLSSEYPYNPKNSKDVKSLLPLTNENPEKITNLLQDFKTNAINLSIGINLFFTFSFYIRSIPFDSLLMFLECSKEDISRMAKFLDLDFYSMDDGNKLPFDDSIDSKKTILIKKENSFLEKLLDFQGFLPNINEEVTEIYESMLEEAIDKIEIKFEPWEDYKELFEFFAKNFVNTKDFIFRLNANNKIHEINASKNNLKLQKEFYLRRFLSLISPLICIGLISFWRVNIRNILFYLPHAKKWVERVIDNKGKA